MAGIILPAGTFRLTKPFDLTGLSGITIQGANCAETRFAFDDNVDYVHDPGRHSLYEVDLARRRVEESCGAGPWPGTINFRTKNADPYPPPRR